MKLKPMILSLSILALATQGAFAFDKNKDKTREQIKAEAKLEKNEPTDRLIIKYKNGSEPTAQSLANVQVNGNRKGLKIAKLRDGGEGGKGHKIFQMDKKLSKMESDDLIKQIKDSDPNIEYIEADKIMQPMLTPTDTNYSQQWDLFEPTAGIYANLAWDITTGTGVKVAVIDTGVRRHIDLATNLVGGYDFIANTTTSNDGNLRDTDPLDPGDWVTAGFCGTGSLAKNSSWHGTHVAGTIAAVSNNARGVAGIAYGAKVVPIRALGRCGGYMSDIADAMIWAAGGTVTGVPANANPAKVINLSLGGLGACDATMQNAVNAARAKGSTVVVAAGNSASDASLYSPASCQGVITVAAVNRSGALASYSNFGPAVDIAAPGGDGTSNILSTLNTGTTTAKTDSYAAYKGTSMAAPHVAATVALMLAKNPALTPDQVETKLKETAAYRGFPVACTGCGSGILRSDWAVQSAMGTFVPPTTTPGTPGTPSTPTFTTVNEVEPNNTLTAPQVVKDLNSVTANWSSTTDEDFFSIVVPAGRAVEAVLTSNIAADFDLNGYYNGQLLGYSSGAGTPNEILTLTNGLSTSITFVFNPIYVSGTRTGAYNITFRFK